MKKANHQNHQDQQESQGENDQPALAQTSTGLLTLEALQGDRNRRGSTSSFMSALSSASETGYTTEPCDQNVDTILQELQEEVDKMEKATEKQKNISIVVKDGLKKIRALLADLRYARSLNQARSQGTTERTAKTLKRRVRSPGSSPGLTEGPEKRKKTTSNKKSFAAQVTEGISTTGGTVQEGTTVPKPGTSTENPQEAWRTVETKKKKNKNKKAGEEKQNGSETLNQRTRPAHKTSKQNGGVVLIRPSEGNTFADVVRSLRTIEGADNALVVKSVSLTKDGAALVRTKGQKQTPKEINSFLQNAIGCQGVVKDLTPKVTIEILDMDCLTDIKEVQSALEKELGADEDDTSISVLGPNARGLKIAICNLRGQDATRLLQKGHIKVGFVSCRVRARLMIPRCYKCLGFGHHRQDCTGPDRRDCCWKCGGGGHKARACTSGPTCFLCSPQSVGGTAHVPGSSSCAAFKAALTEARTGQRTVRT